MENVAFPANEKNALFSIIFSNTLYSKRVKRRYYGVNFKGLIKLKSQKIDKNKYLHISFIFRLRLGLYMTH